MVVSATSPCCVEKCCFFNYALQLRLLPCPSRSSDFNRPSYSWDLKCPTVAYGLNPWSPVGCTVLGDFRNYKRWELGIGKGPLGSVIPAHPLLPGPFSYKQPLTDTSTTMNRVTQPCQWRSWLNLSETINYNKSTLK